MGRARSQARPAITKLQGVSTIKKTAILAFAALFTAPDAFAADYTDAKAACAAAIAE